MSKSYQGYMGPQIGKLGTAVGRMWKGRPVMAAYQKNVANPNTLPQQLVRARFAACGKMATACLTAIQEGMGYAAKQLRLTESNVFVKDNFSKFTAVSPDEVNISYSGIKFSKGTLPSVTFGVVDFGEGEHLHLSVALTGNSDAPGAMADDKVYILAYCPELQQGILSLPTMRSSSTISMALPSAWDGMDIHVYGFTVTGPHQSKKRVSYTTYCGTGEVA